MRKLLIFFILLSSLSFAQTTTVTATVTFPDTNTFQNGTVLATFTPPGGIIDQNLYLINGSQFPYYVSGVFDGTGTFTLTLTDDHLVRPIGGRWMFTVCSVATTPCTNSLQDVFGGSINLSTLISNDVKNIFSPPTNFPTYFTDSEVDNKNVNGIYFDYVTRNFRCWNGISWSNCIGGGGGGGSVVSVSAGNLLPIFTTSVSNSTTTPSISFTLTNAPPNTVLANETNGSASPVYAPDSITINTTSPLTGGAVVNLGGVITLACPTCSVPQVSVTATSPIVVTPSPGVSTFVISCPTCGVGTGSVTSFSSGNLSPLFTTNVTNPTTTPALAFTLSSAGAHTVFANETGSSTLPSFQSDQVTINTSDILSGGGVLELGGTLTLSTSVTSRRRVCNMRAGSDDGAGLVDADVAPQSWYCFIPYAATVQEVEIVADAGTPTAVVAKNHAGSVTDLLSGALSTAALGAFACSNTGGTTGINGVTTCTNTLSVTSIAAGDYVFVHTGTASTAKVINASVVWTVN